MINGECVDFASLNKACLKASFPLLNIDKLVDGSSREELLRFMDAYFGYNQIRMMLDDKEKPSFIINEMEGTFSIRSCPLN